MVWKGSTTIGCGIVGKYAVCRYSTAGNKVGDFKTNVFRRGINNLIKKNAGESCGLVDGRRPGCSMGLCCGSSTKVADNTNLVEHCMMSELQRY